MSEPDFSNREINEKFDNIKEILHRIEAQTTKTNGRVTALEIKQEGLFAKVSGVATIISGIVGVAITKLLS